MGPRMIQRFAINNQSCRPLPCTRQYIQERTIPARRDFRRLQSPKILSISPQKPPTLSCWFKQFDRIAVRIFYLNLTSPRTAFHIVSEAKTRVFETGDRAREV